MMITTHCVIPIIHPYSLLCNVFPNPRIKGKVHQSLFIGIRIKIKYILWTFIFTKSYHPIILNNMFRYEGTLLEVLIREILLCYSN